MMMVMMDDGDVDDGDDGDGDDGDGDDGDGDDDDGGGDDDLLAVVATNMVSPFFPHSN